MKSRVLAVFVATITWYGAALAQGAAATTPSASPPSPPPPPACKQVEYRQFDFWIGKWEVMSSTGGKKLGDSHIELVAGGCVLLENWTGAGGSTGKSLNMYDSTDRQWHQSWYDSSGSRLDLAGKFADGKMVLSSAVPDPAKPGVTIHQRITWTPNADGSVRQLWESSSDSGKNWTVAFDGKYIKRP